MGKKGGGTVTQSQALDPQALQYRNATYAAGTAAAGQPLPGVDPQTMQAMQAMQGYGQAGNLGLSAMQGNAGALQAMMDPYQHQVIDAANQQFGQQQAQLGNSIASQATAAGAFGGSRHGVAQGVAQGQLGMGQQQQIAQLLSQGYGDAMNRAQGLAGMGMQANGALASLGQYSRQVGIDQQNHVLDTRLRTMGGLPYGTTQTQHTQSNGLGSVLGGAATLAGMIPGVGGMVGAGLRGLGGLFGGSSGPSVGTNFNPFEGMDG